MCFLFLWIKRLFRIFSGPSGCLRRIIRLCMADGPSVVHVINLYLIVSPMWFAANINPHLILSPTRLAAKWSRRSPAHLSFPYLLPESLAAAHGSPDRGSLIYGPYGRFSDIIFFAIYSKFFDIFWWKNLEKKIKEKNWSSSKIFKEKLEREKIL